MSIMSLRWRVLALLVVVPGSAVGLVGSAFQEVLHGGLAVAFVAAPMIEEALKPSGVYLVLAKWPQALGGRLYTACLSALAGLTFGLIENILYLRIYFPEHSQEAAVFRFTAALALHTVAGFIFGLGINRSLAAFAKGEIPFSALRKRFFIAAMALHASYNIAVTIFLRDLR